MSFIEAAAARAAREQRRRFVREFKGANYTPQAEAQGKLFPSRTPRFHRDPGREDNGQKEENVDEREDRETNANHRPQRLSKCHPPIDR